MSGARRFWSNVAGRRVQGGAASCATTRRFIGVVLVQPIMMLLLFGVGALEQAGQRAVGGARPERRRARRAGSSRTCRRPATSCRRAPVDELRRGARRCCARGKALAVARHPATTSRRDAERGRRRACSSCSTAAIRSSAARVGGYVGAGRRPAFEPRDAATPRPRSRAAGADRRAPALLVQPDARATASSSSPALAGMLLTNLCLSVDRARPRRRARERHLRADAGAADDAARDRPRQARCRYVGVSYVVLLFVDARDRRRLRLLAAGQLARARRRHAAVRARLAGDRRASSRRSRARRRRRSSSRVFFILPSFVLSGVMLPYQLMPHGVREIGALFPLRWYQIALRRDHRARRRARRRRSGRSSRCSRIFARPAGARSAGG